MTRKLVITGLVAAAVVAGASSSSGQPPAASGPHAAGTRSVTVHTFVAPRVGWLRAVSFVVDPAGHPRMTVELRAAGPDGTPTRTVLAAARPVTAAAGRIRVLLPTPPTVAAGRSYAIVVTAPLGSARVWMASPEFGDGPAPAPFACTPS
jgi:hypothetical protein